ncbi:MAG: hypothetical protein WCJ68_04260 [Chitinophagia bacterium]|jgi:hypothetical protein
MKIYPLKAVFFALIFISSQVVGQAKADDVVIETITQAQIGALKCSYFKLGTLKEEYQVRIIYKNQKYIYQQESDTINIVDKSNLSLFIKDLKDGLSIIDDNQKSQTFNRGLYIISKDNNYIDNQSLTFWNKDYNISASINKTNTIELIDWLVNIKF